MDCTFFTRSLEWQAVKVFPKFMGRFLGKKLPGHKAGSTANFAKHYKVSLYRRCDSLHSRQQGVSADFPQHLGQCHRWSPCLILARFIGEKMAPPCLFAFPPLPMRLRPFCMNVSHPYLGRNILNLKRWREADEMRVGMVGLWHPLPLPLCLDIWIGFCLTLPVNIKSCTLPKSVSMRAGCWNFKTLAKAD